MPDHDEPAHDPELTHQQEAEVRRLLLDARHTGPTPEAVVARLDRVLGGLADEPGREATVVRLADRRRRATAILLGAAASVAAVIGIGQLVSPSADDTSATTAETGDSAPEASGPESGSAGGGALARDLDRLREPYAVTSEQFARDAGVLQDQAEPLPGSVGDTGSDTDTDAGAPAELATDGRALRRAQDRAVCEPGGWGRGRYVAVLYDRAEGWVVFRQPRGDTQVADLFLCGSETAVRTVTLRYP